MLEPSYEKRSRPIPVVNKKPTPKPRKHLFSANPISLALSECNSLGRLPIFGAHALLVVRFQGTEVGFVAVYRPLKGCEQPLGGIETHHHALSDLDGFSAGSRFLLSV